MNRSEKLISRLGSTADGIIITDLKNQKYISGFDFTDGFVIATHNGTYLLTDFRYIEAAREQAFPHVKVLLIDQHDPAGSVRSVLDADGVRRLAYEEYSLSCLEKSEYERGILAGYDLVPSGRAIISMRERKDADEIATIIEAQKIADAAFDHILGYITPERTELDVALELEFYMRTHGAKSVSFDTIAVSGTASSRPHGVPSDRKLEEGFLTMDFGALYKGYCSDMTRTVCVGKCTDEMRRVYETVLEAQLTALDAYSVGKTGAELDGVARKFITDAGYGEYFGHGLGHGVGMDIHEAPSVNKRGIVPMDVGHVVTCEPGIYIEGKFGVRIEDMVVFTENGPLNITHSPKNLITL